MVTHAATEKLTEEWFSKGSNKFFRIVNATYPRACGRFIAKDLPAMKWARESEI
jgi:hypothetical protein